MRNSHFGQSHFNFNVDGHNYHVLRTGCFPFIKYHCTKRPYTDLNNEDRLMRMLKILNLGLPMLAYGVAACFLIKYVDSVDLEERRVPVYFLIKETHN